MPIIELDINDEGLDSLAITWTVSEKINLLPRKFKLNIT